MGSDSPRSGLPIGRAAFFGTVVAGIAGIAVAPRLNGAIAGLGESVPALGALVPDSGWRIYTVNPPMPTFDPASYRLRVNGLVERPLDLGWEDVLAIQGRRQTSDFHCVTGWSVDDVRWEGIGARTLVDLVQPRASATHVRFVSMEVPYEDQLELGQFVQPDVMLARGMDGRPMPREHGAPLRLVIPRMYGYKGVKWVSEIVFEDTAKPGYWEQRGYDTNAWLGHSNGYG